MSLLYISQQITIYGGWFLVVAGTIGNAINILIFSSVHAYRTNPCTFYFLSLSIDNFIYVIIYLTSHIYITGYGIDSTRTSVVWCKARSYFLSVFTFISFTFSCLASIDQFLVTSPNANLRRLSSIKWAHRIIFIVMIVWIIHGIPILVFVNLIPTTNTCLNTNAGYAIYVSIYVLSLTCFIPVTIMIVFGYLTYRNIHSRRILADQQADLQVVKMTLIQVVLVVIAIVPYGINNAYSLITSEVIKDSDRLKIESFVLTTTSLLTYINYVVCVFIIFFDQLYECFCFLGRLLYVFNFIASISS
jgi:hypothetical protein